MTWQNCAVDFAKLVEAPEGKSLPTPVTQSPEFQNLLDCGLILTGLERTTISCPRCREHHEIYRDKNGGAFVYCIDGPEEVDRSDLVRWRCDWRQLGLVISRNMQSDFHPRRVKAGWVMLVAELPFRNSSIPVWLARGLSSPQHAPLTLQALSSTTPRRQGLIIAPTNFRQVDMPHGSKWLDLAAVFDPARLPNALDCDAVWRAAGPINAPPTVGRRGNPGKPGDPVQIFRDRVRDGKAMDAIGQEAAAIRKIESDRFGKKRAHSESHIENLIRGPFNAWQSD